MPAPHLTPGRTGAGPPAALGGPAFGWRDLAATALMLALLVLVGLGAQQMTAPLAAPSGPAAPLALSPLALPADALRTVLRMLAALAASLVFSLAYATAAARIAPAETILVPLLDVLQSVPVLGYLSFSVLFFLALFPGNQLGAELAAIFAIFTSQAWNMTFSVYQSLRTVPRDLDEAARSLRASTWQRFWRLEIPFAMPGLVWNAMMSMAGSWFFVVASEAISVGDVRVTLPGIGSYLAQAIAQRDLASIGWAIVAMSLTIVACDQLLFQPVVAWSDKFRVEQAAAQQAPRSWLLDLMRQTWPARPLGQALAGVLHAVARAPLRWTADVRASPHVLAAGWYAAAALFLLWLGAALLQLARPALGWADVAEVMRQAGITLLRVLALTALASAIWVPIGVIVGLRPRWTARVQPIVQFLAAFPANLLFPAAVYLIVRFGLAPALWLTPLMMLGTQWYILFNVIAGASAFPHDLGEAAASLRLRRLTWWRRVMLPGIFPYYVTGALTASGGAWNASIVAETVNWGDTRLDGGGLGAYITRMTLAGDFPRIALGIAAMSLFVIAVNRILWRPLYAYAARRTRLD